MRPGIPVSKFVLCAPKTRFNEAQAMRPGIPASMLFLDVALYKLQ